MDQKNVMMYTVHTVHTRRKTVEEKCQECEGLTEKQKEAVLKHEKSKKRPPSGCMNSQLLLWRLRCCGWFEVLVCSIFPTVGVSGRLCPFFGGGLPGLVVVVVVVVSLAVFYPHLHFIVRTLKLLHVVVVVVVVVVVRFSRLTMMTRDLDSEK